MDYGIQCPGYRPSADKDLRFVDQTGHLAQKSGDRIQNQWHMSTPASTRQYRWRNQVLEPVSATQPHRIDSKHIHRVQLLSTFLDLYLPKRCNTTLTSSFDYIAELPQIDSASPLLQTSIDALCLAELGSLYRDERCLRESQARYVRALPMLSNELARPSSKRLRSDYILAAVAVLTLCELFDGIARGNDDGQGYISHVRGAQQYIKALGPKGISTSLGWHLFHNVRHQSMCLGFVERKAVFFADPDWLELTRNLSEYNQFTALYDITLHIPGILEQIDRLASFKSSCLETAFVCHEICRVRSWLESWSRKFYIDQSAEAYDIAPIRDMADFASLCLDRTFQTAFSFDSVQSCSQQQLYWVCCLILDSQFLATYRCLLESDLGPEMPLSTFTSRCREDIERDMFVAATSYCRSLPFCCKPEVASVGRVGTFLLRIVQNYFEHNGHCKESEWCNAVRRMLHSYSNNQTGVEHIDDTPGAPWKVKHSCRSPICNFRIECVAPAPLLLDGEYPSNGYKPRHDSREVKFDQPAISNCNKGFAFSENEGHTSLGTWKQMHKGTLPGEVPRANGASAMADERVLAGDSVLCSGELIAGYICQHRNG